AIEWSSPLYGGYQEAVIHVTGTDATHVTNVTVENLAVVGGRITDSIKDSSGAFLSYYNDGSSHPNPAAIRLEDADYSVVRNCELSKTNLGIGGNAKVGANTGVDDTVYEGNYFHDTDNGGTYTEGYGTAWYQFNRFGGCD